jgi:hypothetical protein
MVVAIVSLILAVWALSFASKYKIAEGIGSIKKELAILTG